MPYLFDLFYLLALLAFSPWLVYKALTTGKYRRGLCSKLVGLSSPLTTSPPHHLATSPPRRVAWFHGVSVGEIHLLRQVVAGFRARHPDWSCVISTTTDTGFDEAGKWFPDLPVIYWPFDFSWAVRRSLRRVDPALVVLAEVELWPNFLMATKARGVPVAVINGRMSPRSFHRYARLRELTRYLLGHVDLFAVQNEAYAGCFRDLGATAGRVQVTGSVKYDHINSDRENPRTREFRRLFRVDDGDLIWITGSTQEPEEQLILGIFGRLKTRYPNLRLFLVPRQRERFNDVAALLRRSEYRFQRRSELRAAAVDRSAVILIDTIGELGALWGLADVAFVGGSLDGRRGGQNMIEPAAYGTAVIFGPHVWNFQDTAAKLIGAGAAVQVSHAAALEEAVARLLGDSQERHRLGSAAQTLVRSQQGATERTLDCLDRLLSAGRRRSDAA